MGFGIQRLLALCYYTVKASFLGKNFLFAYRSGSSLRQAQGRLIGLRQLAALSLAIVISFSGCTTLQPKDDDELNNLVQAYVKHNKQLKESKKARREQGINKLLVEKSPSGPVVSVDLEKALIPVVVQRLIKEANLSYLLEDVSMSGTITAHFNKRPLIETLNLILEPVLLTAEERNNIIHIGTGIKTDDKSATAQAQISMKNLDVTTVSTLLDGLYPRAPATGGRVVNFGAIPNTNTIYLNGPKALVSQAIKTLVKADKDVMHVMLEVVLVEFDSKDFEKLGMEVQNLISGPFSGVNLNFGSFATDAVSLAFTEGVRSPESLTAILDVLISEEKARLISRPYVSTISGKEAEINIATDRYVITQTAVSGAAITSPVPVTSGVLMKITPTVMPDNKIRMNIDVEDSQFATAAADVAVEVNKNSVTTIMQVEDSQTIVIGGLVLNRRAWKNSGAPFVRKIPLINAFFAKQEVDITQREVAIYVTPHIWDPNIVIPLIKQDALKSKNKEEDKGLKK